MFVHQHVPGAERVVAHLVTVVRAPRLAVGAVGVKAVLQRDGVSKCIRRRSYLLSRISSVMYNIKPQQRERVGWTPVVPSIFYRETPGNDSKQAKNWGKKWCGHTAPGGAVCAPVAALTETGLRPPAEVSSTAMP